MKITRLVVLFNKDKIILGLLVSILGLVLSLFVSPLAGKLLIAIGILILINICLSIYASYRLYDHSNLYKPDKLFDSFQFTKNDKCILLHASFDPVSNKLEELLNPENLKVYNIYGNRHEKENSIKISNKVFPPHPDQITVEPTNLPDEDGTIDYIYAITSAHEIHSHENRVKFFKEAKRVLKSNGSLILCEQMRNPINFISFNIGAFHFLSMKEWQKAISSSGLRIKKVEKITVWGTMILIGK